MYSSYSFSFPVGKTLPLHPPQDAHPPSPHPADSFTSLPFLAAFALILFYAATRHARTMKAPGARIKIVTGTYPPVPAAASATGRICIPNA